MPVARALWFEDDPAWQPDGRPAYVRAKVDGDWRLPFLASRDPADDERRIEAAKEHLAKLAAHPHDRLAGARLRRAVPRAGRSRPMSCPTSIRLFLDRLSDVQQEPSPVLAEGVDWLLATAPLAPCVTFCKGTNGHGEEVWRDGRIVAMSDWELACIAEPAYDLAQVQEMVPTIEREGRHVWGWPEALAHYERLQRHPGHVRAGGLLPALLRPADVRVHPSRRLPRPPGRQPLGPLRVDVDRDAVPGRAAVRRRRWLRPGARPMMLPDVDDELACLIDTIEAEIAPHVDDDYAASLCLTVGPGAALRAGPRRSRGPGPP